MTSTSSRLLSPTPPCGGGGREGGREGWREGGRDGGERVREGRRVSEGERRDGRRKEQNSFSNIRSYIHVHVPDQPGTLYVPRYDYYY